MRKLPSYKVEINVSYSLGRSFGFTKILNLPFVPLLGISISDEYEEDGEEYSLDIKLEDTHEVCTEIFWETKKERFYIEIRHNVNQTTSSQYIDNIIKEFQKTGWKSWGLSYVNEIKSFINKINK